MKDTCVSVYSVSRAGHRGAYIDFFQSLFGGSTCNRWGALRSMDPVLFLLIEDGFAHYVAVALLRAVLGRRTVGLLFRPGPAARGASLRLRIKRSILRLLKRIDAVTTLSIVPVPLDPCMEDIVDGWIYDFQLWDLTEQDRDFVSALRALRIEASVESAATALARQIAEAAAGRRVLASIGTQSRIKGFDRFTSVAAEASKAGWLLVSAGRIDCECTAERAELEYSNAVIIDRYISDEEILAVYAASDAAWCLYDESYDQASGILGRAAQIGLPVVVREGSLSHSLCRVEGVPFVAACGDGDVLTALSALPESDVEQGERLSARLREYSLERLSAALGVPSRIGQ